MSTPERPVSATYTTEQRRRVLALREAKSLLTVGTLTDVLRLARWIVSGTVPTGPDRGQ